MADNWDNDEVLRRYHKLHRGTLLTQKFMNGDTLSQGE
ncbi:MAG: transposase, partial [Rickettsiales bacterium]|nr:transposase [Rickettsiales bacterium]